MTEPTTLAPAAAIPSAIATCCREWIVAATGGWGRCGLCGTRPAFTRMLEPHEWTSPTTKAPDPTPRDA